MPRIPLRFKTLQEREIAKTWRDVKNLIEHHNFPAGRRLGLNKRIWFEDEVDAWFESLPSASEAKPPLKGFAARGGSNKCRQEKLARETAEGK